MAVSLDELASIGGYSKVLKEGKAAYLNLTGISYKKEENLDKTLSLLKHYCNRAKQTEKDILRCFEVNNEIELKAKFKKFFVDSGLASFIGPKFYNEVVYKYKNNYEAGESEFMDYIENDFIAEVVDGLEKPLTEPLLTNKALELLQSTIKNSDIKITQQVKKELFKVEGDSIVILLDNFSKNRKKALQEKFKEAKIAVTTNGSETKAKSTIKLNYFSATQGKKKSEISDEDRERLRKILKEEIPNYFGEKYGYTSYKILEDMLMQNPDAFFVGKNSNDIIGVLGEYTAAAALNALIPTTSIEQCIRWTAKDTYNGGQISSDFIVNFSKEVNFGIQVKNTTKDFENEFSHKISFIDNVAIETIFNRLTQVTGINFKDFIDAYSSLMVSKDFNVPYIYYTDKDGKTIYKEGSLNPNPYKTHSKKDEEKQKITSLKNASFGNYLTLRKTHLKLLDQINIFLASFAPYLLYMGIDASFEGGLANLEEATAKLIGGGNNLYLVAGEPFFVSSMLENIIKELEEYKAKNEYSMNSLNISTLFLSENKDQPFSGNIVDYKNSNAKEISVNVRMTSSYNFKYGY